MSFNDGFNDSLQRILVDGRADLNADFWREVKLSPAGARYFEDYVSPANNAKLLETACLLYPNEEHITVAIAVDSIATLINAGELVAVREPEPTPVEQAPIPTDRNGRPLSAAQISWSEYLKFSNDHSMKDVRERARTDSGYAAFVTKQRENELDQPIDGDVREYNEGNVLLVGRAPVSQAALTDHRLVAFADEYRRTPTSKVRLLKSIGSNPSAAQYTQDETDCYNLGLL